MRTGMWLAAVALVTVLAAGCGGRIAQPPSGGGPGPAGSPAGPTTITIVGKDNFFEPAIVTIKAGQEAEIDFKNQGTNVHNLIVQAKDQVGQDFNSDIAVNAGQESTFKVKIDKPGTYVMQCTYHPEMKGELKVR